MKKSTTTTKPAQKATRLKILKAARKVFAQYAYHAASIRCYASNVTHAEQITYHPLCGWYVIF
jgi:hypothetical protein